MTLSPVFRSPEAVRLLKEEGVWTRLEPAIRGQAEAVATVQSDMEGLLDPRYRTEPQVPDPEGLQDPQHLTFVQDYFFLILFRSLFESLGVGPDRLRLYSELDFCIKGTITAADNLFDDQGKSLLPLRTDTGPRFLSILQLMCFERLLQRALDRAAAEEALQDGDAEAVQRGLLDRMAAIGELEGSEEGGVDETPTPDAMMERVHRVRGGALFSLAFVAPLRLEAGEVARRLQEAEPAVARLGTAFQIVDDLTDFEFDLGRGSHNLLVSEVHHHGSEAERERLTRLQAGDPFPERVVEEAFPESARRVLGRAYEEARASFEDLARLGFWFPPDLHQEVVHAIVGLEGVARIRKLTSA